MIFRVLLTFRAVSTPVSPADLPRSTEKSLLGLWGTCVMYRDCLPPRILTQGLVDVKGDSNPDNFALFDLPGGGACSISDGVGRPTEFHIMRTPQKYIGLKF